MNSDDFIEQGMVPAIDKIEKSIVYTYVFDNNVIVIDKQGNNMDKIMTDDIKSLTLYNLDKNNLFQSKYEYEKSCPLCNHIDANKIKRVLEDIEKILFKEELNEEEKNIVKNYCVFLLISANGEDINTLLKYNQKFFTWIENILFIDKKDGLENILLKFTNYYDTEIKKANNNIKNFDNIVNEEIPINDMGNNKIEQKNIITKIKKRRKRKWYQLGFLDKLFLIVLLIFFLISLNPKFAIRTNLLTKGEYKIALSTDIKYQKEIKENIYLYTISDKVITGYKYENKYYVLKVGIFYFAHIA